MRSKVKSGNFLVIGILVFIFLFTAILFTTLSPAPKAVLQIKKFSGKAEISLDGILWKTPVLETNLNPFAFARTGEGEILFRYNDGAEVSLAPHSKMQFTSASRYSSLTGRLHLMAGSLEVHNWKEKIQISTARRGEIASRKFWQDITKHFIHLGPESTLRITLRPGEPLPVIEKVKGPVKIESLFPRSSRKVTSALTDEMVQHPTQ